MVKLDVLVRLDLIRRVNRFECSRTLYMVARKSIYCYQQACSGTRNQSWQVVAVNKVSDSILNGTGMCPRTLK